MSNFIVVSFFLGPMLFSSRAPLVDVTDEITTAFDGAFNNVSTVPQRSAINFTTDTEEIYLLLAQAVSR